MIDRNAADLVAFATLGVVVTAQHLAVAVIRAVPRADSELVAEEAMTLVATVTARTLDADTTVGATLGDLPALYRDYALGTAMLEGDEPTMDPDPYESLNRRMAFYEVHFPIGKAPNPADLREKMELWMGRVSPPGLEQTPTDRLRDLGLVETVLSHMKLVKTMAEQP